MSVEKFLYRHWGKILFAANFFLGFFILWQGRKLGLFAPPRPGMDQHTILEAAQNIANGIFPVPGKYLYSPAYTLFLGLSAKIGGGNLFVMRLVQLAVVSLVPWMIYRTSIFAGFGRKAAAVAGVLWLFCGSAMLISLDFLRAAPLALCFVSLVYFGLRSRRSSRLRYAVFAGVFAGLCMLGRENFIPVVCLPLLFMIFPLKKKQSKKIAVYILAALLTLTPVLAYNFYHTSSLAILPGNGKNVFEFMQGKGTLSTPGQAALQVIRKIPQTAWRVITPFENTNSLSFYAHREAIPLLKVLSLPITLLFALVFAAAYDRKRSIYLILLLIAGYFCSLVFCEIYYRFRIPALPLLCMAGGAGVMQLSVLFKKRSKLAFAFLLPVLAAIGIWMSVVPERLIPQSEREATVRFFLDRKQYAKAGELLLKYRTCGVASPAGERFLLGLLVRDGKQSEAIFWYNEFSNAK